jgi:protein-S-isoprenylcysteine O-methyltransferase Ste14
MKKDSPGVKFPPPLYYILAFLVSIFIQKYIPLGLTAFQISAIKITGIVILLISLVFVIPSLLQFARTKNTVVTILPATSLQTGGIYKITINPMYMGLILSYTGISCICGNWWNFIFLVFIVFQQYRIIKKEENYLEREFGQQYIDYKQKVRRWL